METPSKVLRCPRCQRHRDISQFYVDRSKTSGHKSHCKKCTKSENQKWKSQNRCRVAEGERTRRQRDAFLRQLGREAEALVLKHRCLEDPRTNKSYLANFDKAPGVPGFDFVDDDDAGVTRKDRRLNKSPTFEHVKEVYWEIVGDENVDYWTKTAIEAQLFELFEALRLLAAKVDDWHSTKDTCLILLRNSGLIPEPDVLDHRFL